MVGTRSAGRSGAGDGADLMRGRREQSGSSYSCSCLAGRTGIRAGWWKQGPSEGHSKRTSDGSGARKRGKERKGQQKREKSFRERVG